MSRSVKWRKILLVLGLVLAVSAVGGAVTLLLTYHEATKIDRGNPKVVLDEYLRATLVSRDEVGADLYECGNADRLSSLKSMRSDLDQRERDFNVEMLVSWGAIDSAEVTGGVQLTTSLTITATENGGTQGRQSELWRFGLVDEDGWRVCSAELVPQPSASPSSSL